MKEVIYLRVDQSGVRGMTKSLPSINRGEIPVKLILEVKDNAFREPVIAKSVVIEDWQEGADLSDVEFNEAVITEEEANLIRGRRFDKMAKLLEAQGYKVELPEGK
jgi:hypothetical protein